MDRKDLDDEPRPDWDDKDPGPEPEPDAPDNLTPYVITCVCFLVLVILANFCSD